MPTSTTTAEKRKDEPQKPSPQQPLKVDHHPVTTTTAAPPNVTANFSMSLPPPKTSSVPVKEPAKVVEEKKDEPKVEVTAETTSFTFSLPGKKEAPKHAAAISFGSSSLNVSDAAKSAFSFGTAGSANTFTFGNKSTGDKTAVVTTSASISSFGGSNTSFSGFSSSGSDTKTSPPTSIFSTLTPATTPAKSDESKVPSSSSSIFSTSSSVSTVVESTKPAST